MNPETISIWTPTTITAVVAGLTALIAAFSGLFVAVGGLRRKADQIHEITNSHLSSVTKSLEVAQTRIDGLERLISLGAQNKKVADDLATKRKPARST